LTSVFHVLLLTFKPACGCFAKLSQSLAAASATQEAAKNMSPGDDEGTTPLKAETALVTGGRDTKAQKGFVNPPYSIRPPTICTPIAASSNTVVTAPRRPKRFSRC
jgi:hypothetical protein